MATSIFGLDSIRQQCTINSTNATLHCITCHWLIILDQPCLSVVTELMVMLRLLSPTLPGDNPASKNHKLAYV